MDQKIENLLNISLEVSPEEREKSPALETGYNTFEKTWELILYYVGDINYLIEKYNNIQVTELLNQYAIIITPERYIEQLVKEPGIIYIEKPKLLNFELTNGMIESCIESVQSGVPEPYRLFGKGTIVAVIDTGINASSYDFRNEDGTTRILNIWDQTMDIIFDKKQIDEALENKNFEDIPGTDIIGHGTKVASIACGKNGVASQSDIIIVKMGLSDKYSFPRTTQLMKAVDFVMRKAMEYNKPVAINISFGNNYGDHAGSSLLETYLNSVSENWKCAICIGSGNEGLGATHVNGNLNNYDEKIIEVAISNYEPSINLQIWKNYWDDFDVEIITPSGKNIGKITYYNKVQKITVENTILLMLYGQPAPYSMKQEIYIDMIPEYQYIREGIWKLKLNSKKVITGRYDMWLPAIGSLNMGTGFTNPDSSMTITIPATADKVISVGAYNSKTDVLAPFSGRGYVSDNGGPTIVKPELVAPGVDILINIAQKVSGTSFATPFVTGSSALLMEWGIVKNNDPYMYGQKVKAYLIKGTRQLKGMNIWPNAKAGWGTLCLHDSIP